MDSLKYLGESEARDKQEVLVSKKLTMLSKSNQSNLENSLRIRSSSKINDQPLTGYEYYVPFFKI